MKTAVNSLRDRIKARIDYDLSGDTDLDALVLEAINDVLKLIKQDLLDYGLFADIGASNTLKLVAGRAFTDIRQARIVGDASTFTPVALDAISVTIDGTAYAVLMAGCTTIALVVTAINTVVGSTVASASTDGYLAITSLTTGSTSSVTIASTAGTPVSRLFTDSTERTRTGISDLDEILRITDRTNDKVIGRISFFDFLEKYPDPAGNTSDRPDEFAFFNNRIYSGPSPNTDPTVYIDYLKQINDLSAGDTLPFENKYDPLVLAWAREELATWLDSKDATSISSAKATRLEWEHKLIIGATNNMGQVNQSASRREYEPRIAPRIPE